MKFGAGAWPGRTLIARCSIHAPLKPGLYALMQQRESLSRASTCVGHPEIIRLSKRGTHQRGGAVVVEGGGVISEKLCGPLERTRDG